MNTCDSRPYVAAGRAVFAEHGHGGVDYFHIVGKGGECEKVNRATTVAKEYLQQKS